MHIILIIGILLASLLFAGLAAYISYQKAIKSVWDTNDSIKNLQHDLLKKEKEITLLSDSIRALRTEFEAMEQERIKILNVRQPERQPIREEEMSGITRELYLSTPNKDGSFTSSSASTHFRPTVSLYQFILLQEDLAEFSFKSDENGLRDALNFSKSYIEPVCDEQNDVTPDSTRIKMISKGLAEKKGDKWIVTKKAVVCYE